MSDTSNIETFNTLVGLIFGQLYEAFPVPVGLNTDEIAQTLGVQGYTVREILTGRDIVAEWGELMDGSAFWSFYSSALSWLCEEGLIRQVEPYEYVLTSAALTALNARPDALKEPLGRRLAGAAGSAASEAGRAAIGEVVGQVIGGVFKVILSSSN
ncbi:MAG TPA: hypothetical protein VGN60_09215 [Devosia sp.]|jgi:hypothetical protein|nr:hypothetical protein [Devosia sp.]